MLGYNPAMRMTSGVVAAIACCGVLGGCTVAPRADSARIADGQELAVLREQARTFSSIDRQLRLVFHDAGSLAMLPVNAGPVDFDREMVLLAALGPTRSEDSAVRIRRLWRDGSVLRAEVQISHPVASALSAGTPASPYHLVVVPRSDLNIAGWTAAATPRVLAGRRPTTR